MTGMAFFNVDFNALMFVLNNIMLNIVNYKAWLTMLIRQLLEEENNLI